MSNLYPGCNCTDCPLAKSRQGGPVPPDMRAGSEVLIVGEAPGANEVKEGRPFVGESGFELWNGLKSIGVSRSQVSITNTILCRPYDNKLSVELAKLRRRNKERMKNGYLPFPTPMECCNLRLIEEVKAAKQVITLGDTAYKAVCKGHESIMSVRGGPKELPWPTGKIKVLPTVHPSFVLRAKRWREAFRSDLSRAFRWFRSGLDWHDPKTLFIPTPEQLAEFLLCPSPFWVCDVETLPAWSSNKKGAIWRVFDPLEDKLGCVGICPADGRTAVVIPFASKEMPGKRFYPKGIFAQIIQILQEFFSSDRWLKVGHNFGYYDRMVLEQSDGLHAQLVNFRDTILYHKFAEPELPHTLAYVGSIHTDVHAWKSEHTATEAKTDKEWWQYNARDIAVNALCYPGLEKAVDARGQRDCVDFAHHVQEICVGLHRTGMLVDQKARRELDSKLLKEALDAKREVQELATQSGWRSKAPLNPHSADQVRDLLFERWGLLPVEYTELGDPSTNDATLSTLLIDRPLPDIQRKVIQLIRTYREKVKLRGTYTIKLRKIDQPTSMEDVAYDCDEEEQHLDDTRSDDASRERAASLKKLQSRPGRTSPDGRIRPDYNSHSVLGWRLSSSGPLNAQNVPKELRHLIRAAPGHALVGCDQAQLELRMCVALSKCKYYTERILGGADPHRDFCIDVYNEKFLRASSDVQTKMRVFIKEFTYASWYWAQVETRYKLLRLKEKEGKFINPSLTVEQVAAMDHAWHRRNPEIQVWWDSLVAEYRKQGYLREPIIGARCDFLDGEDIKKFSNFKAQSGGAAIVHIANRRILDEIPFGKWGPGTGQIQQGHDALVFEVKAEHTGPQVTTKDEQGRIVHKWCKDPKCKCTPARVSKQLEEAMTIDGKNWGLNMVFTGESKIGNHWGEV